MKVRPAHAIIPLAIAAAIVVPLAMQTEPQSAGQIVPGPPTTPQPTVPCTPPGLPSENGGAGCGRGPGIQRDVAYAWIDRYCNGDAVPTPPGFTTFALNYGLGGQSSGPVQFSGTLEANGVEIPSIPLALLQPGQKDTRIRTGVVPDGVTFTVTITGTVVATGQPVIFGNGSTVRVREASGSCALTPTPLLPTLPPDFPTPTFSIPPLPEIPTISIPELPSVSLPRGSRFPEVL